MRLFIVKNKSDIFKNCSQRFIKHLMTKSICSLIVLALLGNLQVVHAQTRTKKKLKTKTKLSAAVKSKDMLALLQGRWASSEDQKTFIQIEGDKQISIYGRDVLDTATINFYKEYPVHVTDADPKLTSGSYMVVQKTKNDYLIYGVEQLTSSRLTLMYLPKGSLLHYKKVR
jgi:hypothetical protein